MRNLLKNLNHKEKLQGLDETLKEKITSIITDYKPVDKIVLFGSRSGSKFVKTSDLDLAIYSNDWTSTDINIVQDRLEEYIPTILQFDLLLFHTLKKESLKKEIERGVTIYDGGPNQRTVSRL